MSTLTRRATLASSVLAAVRGKMKGERLEDERPDDDETTEDETPEDAEDTGTEEKASETGDEPKAEDDPNDPEAEGEDEDEKTSAKGRDASSIRRAEQGRIKAILTHPAAAAHPQLASELAFGAQYYSAKQAGELLQAAGGGRLADRMSGRSPKLGSGGGQPQGERQATVSAVKSIIQAKHGRHTKGA